MRTIVLLLSLSVPAAAQEVSQLTQLEPNSVTPIPAGGTAAGTTVQLRATVNSGIVPVNTPSLRVLFEVKPIGTPFDGQGLLTTGYQDFPATFTAVATNLAPGSYQWRARGEWQQFGSIDDWVEYAGVVDFVIQSTNLDPNPPAALRMVDPVSGNTIPSGGTWPGQFEIEGVVTDPDVDQVGLRAYVAEMNSPYPVTPTVETAVLSPSGTLLVLPVSALPFGSYRIRIEAVDQFGAVSVPVELFLISGEPIAPLAGRSRSSGGGCSATADFRVSPGWISVAFLFLFLIAGKRKGYEIGADEDLPEAVSDVSRDRPGPSGNRRAGHLAKGA